eukprot:909089-Pyramimonas_sp.AAC.1
MKRPPESCALREGARRCPESIARSPWSQSCNTCADSRGNHRSEDQWMPIPFPERARAEGSLFLG